MLASGSSVAAPHGAGGAAFGAALRMGLGRDGMATPRFRSRDALPMTAFDDFPHAAPMTAVVSPARHPKIGRAHV